MQHAHSSRSDAEPLSAAVRRKPRSRFRVGYARDAAEEEEADASEAGAPAIHGDAAGRTSSPAMSSGPASEPQHIESSSGAAPESIRTRANHSTAPARQQGTASLAALTGEETALQHAHNPVSEQPIISPDMASASRTSLANQARVEAVASGQAHSAADEVAHRLGSAADAMPTEAAIDIGSVTAADGGASMHKGLLPATEDMALSPVRLTAVASHATNAFDAALGFGSSQLEAAPVSMFESGLEGHTLSDKVIRVRQRLEMEQDRLTSGAIADVICLPEEVSCASQACTCADAWNVKAPRVLCHGAGLHKAVAAEQQAKALRQQLSQTCTAARGVVACA